MMYALAIADCSQLLVHISLSSVNDRGRFFERALLAI